MRQHTEPSAAKPKASSLINVAKVQPSEQAPLPAVAPLAGQSQTYRQYKSLYPRRVAPQQVQVQQQVVPSAVPSYKPTKQQRIDQAFEDRRLRTMDPALGYAPAERLLDAIAIGLRKQEAMRMEPEKSQSITNARWRERGPNNVGGRTRCLLVDANDPDGKRVWAGSVSGGLWRCDDITATVTRWISVNDYLPNLAVMDIVQSPINPNLMFFCTGEYTDIRGIGVFRSTDGGTTWHHLPTTIAFFYCFKMLVHPVNGDVYVTTDAGVWRSQDNGETWARIIGNGTSGVSANRFYDIELASNGHIFVSSRNAIFRSPSGNVGTWTNITNSPGAPPAASQRIEFDVAESDPQVIYAVNDIDGDVEGIYRTNNGGAFWTRTSMPQALGMDNFARGQAWYDLDISVHPTNPARVIVGGIDLHLTTNSGSSWTQISQWFGGGGIQYVHADQHRIVYDPKNSNIIYFTNDGGVYRTTNGNAPASQLQINDRNISYNTSQFYAGAIHPQEARSYYIGGTQDNGSIALGEPGISPGRQVLGGDGFFCHIDEDEPDIQMVSLYFANYSLSTNGGRSFFSGASLNGNFLSASGYDSRTNILYSQTRAADFYRWNVTTGTTTPVDVADLNLDVSAVAVDPNIPNRVYFGNFNGGRIVRVDNAHEGNVVDGIVLTPLAGVISCIEIEQGNPEHLLVTVSNYGLPSVFESFDGGQTWINVEGDLPDMPVNFAIFNPDNNRQAFLATEAGVWTTDLLNGEQTRWYPPAAGRGTPFVRTDMLRLRRSDKVILAATHGRGMFISDVLATPTARMRFDELSYTRVPIQFFGDPSTNAESWFWQFGDGATSNDENPQHAYANVGTYPVSLTINNSLQTARSIKILPDLPLPWKEDKPNWGGNLEGFTEQYGVYTVSGSSWQRGRSTITGKDGTRSGQNAYVVGLTEPFYQPNTHTMLYLPNFDFSQPGIYEFSFWGKWRIHPGFDGFRVEYSTDRGQTWQVLGDSVQTNWYNQRNSNLSDVAFPVGSSYFSGNRNEWSQLRLNVSFLSGNPDVAFRFVFRSDGIGNHIGVAIDDIRIDKYEGELVTRLQSFNGTYVNGGVSVKLDWLTQPEYFCQRIEVERSVNGRDYERIATLNATGGRTLEAQTYTHTSLAQRNLYFYRLKVINEEPAINYSHTFYSPVIVMQRSAPTAAVNRIFPSLSGTSVGVTFNQVVEKEVQYEVLDAAGRLVARGRADAPGPYLEINLGFHLAKAMYVLRLKVGEQNFEAFKFAGGWQ